MKMLTFQANHFQWQTHSKTLENEPDQDMDDSLDHCVVAFFHVEVCDAEDLARTVRRSIKHLKWIANKAQMNNLVLHSFTHLGGDTAPPEVAREVLQQIGKRLGDNGYRIKHTPFGYFCAWSIDVRGESMAKVWKTF